jgi:hypothetical protein
MPALFYDPSGPFLTGFFLGARLLFSTQWRKVDGHLKRKTMASKRTQQIQIRDFDGKAQTLGEMTIVSFTPTERWLRATKFFFIFFGLGLFAVLIPVLHFVLVPLMAFSAVISAVLMVLQKDQIQNCSGPCPYCHESTAFKRAVTRGEFRDACEKCHQLVYVSLS